nr:phosphatase PAP2 family protein [Anaerolineae bacterium]
GTTTLWGAVALQARKRWVTVAVAVYIVLMIMSRMSLGVHFPQDVGLGFVLGLAWLGLYAWIEPKASTWLQKRKLRDQIGLVIAATLVMILVYPGLIRVSSPEWLETSVPIDDLLAGPLTPIAAFMGLGIGFALETKYVGFVAGGNWWKRLLRFAVGIIGVLILRFGLSALFDALSEAIIAWEPLFEGASRFLFRIIRYGLIGLWAGFAAPWAFVKAKLAEGKRA